VAPIESLRRDDRRSFFNNDGNLVGGHLVMDCMRRQRANPAPKWRLVRPFSG
jgi:hypothetical protein